MDNYRMFVFLVIYLINISDSQFTSEPGNENRTVDECLNRNVTLSWNITNYETVLSVTWKKGASTIMSQSGQDPAISIVSNIKHDGNGAVIIKEVQSTDSGEYTCEVVLASGSPLSSTATLSILVAPSNLPQLESVVEKNSIKHKCVLDTKGTPEVDVTIMIGSEDKSSATHSVPCESEEDISCCVSGDAVTCLTESNVTKQCWKLKGNETSSTTQRHATSSTIPTTVITTSVTRNTTDSFPSTRDFVLLVVGEIIFLTIVATIVIYCFQKHCLELSSKCEKLRRHATRRRKTSTSSEFENETGREIAYQAHVNERNSHIPEYQDILSLY